VKRNYRMKKTISIKQFISEFGEYLSKHMKKRILDLWPRCVLTRDEDRCILDLKHVEHTMFSCDSESGKVKKEYAYGQLIIDEGILYFSEKCIENDTVMQAPVVDTIYNSLSSEDMFFGEDARAKKIDDSNIDSIIDNILKVCPPMSQRHLEIISKYCEVDDFNNKKVTC
jgi:hypothetical protein